MEKGTGDADLEFLRLQYSSLRTEQIEKIRQTFALAQFALLATGAAWGWILSQGRDLPPVLRAFAPVAIAVLFTGQYAALRRDVGTLGRRIEALELAFRVPKHLGWESARDETYTRTRTTQVLYWIVLCLANLVLALRALNGA